jgi:hypothetical protein
MSTVDATRLVWRKSSRSTQDSADGDCVEVAFATEAVAVRDSKNRAGDMLAVPALSWDRFLSGL